MGTFLRAFKNKYDRVKAGSKSNDVNKVVETMINAIMNGMTRLRQVYASGSMASGAPITDINRASMYGEVLGAFLATFEYCIISSKYDSVHNRAVLQMVNEVNDASKNVAKKRVSNKFIKNRLEKIARKHSKTLRQDQIQLLLESARILSS